MTKPPTRRSTSQDWLAQAHILTEALPYMQRYAGANIVIKYGGHNIGDAASTHSFAQDVVLLRQAGLRPILVHGGGPQIETMLTRLGVKSQFHNGLRVSHAKTLEVVEMVLGLINKRLVTSLIHAGASAVGISGKDAGLILAKPKTGKANAKLGFVGEPQQIQPKLLEDLAQCNHIPVITPIAADRKGQTYNINADSVAGYIAAALRAARLLLLTDVSGVLDKQGHMMPRLSLAQARTLLRNKTAQGGMIPKLRTAIHAVQHGVNAAVIVDGSVPHAILLELFTGHGAGTLLTRHSGDSQL